LVTSATGPRRSEQSRVDELARVGRHAFSGVVSFVLAVRAVLAVDATDIARETERLALADDLAELTGSLPKLERHLAFVVLRALSDHAAGRAD
jgi:hypothetical protein